MTQDDLLYRFRLRVFAVAVRRGASRDEVLAAIADLGLQVVYFYCHASGARVPPFLEFQRRGGAKGAIHPANLEVRHENQLWACHPPVVLNGCRTAAFDPTAMSPFIETLVENRSAAAVIGTEVSVHEALATEVGGALVAGFVRGEHVGDVIRTIRRKLLARHNQLGLAYTLYGVAELRLSGHRDGPPEHRSGAMIEDKTGC